MMQTILANGPLAVAHCIEAVNAGYDLPLERRAHARGDGVRPARRHRGQARRHARLPREARREVHGRVSVAEGAASRASMCATFAISHASSSRRRADGLVVIGENGQGKTNLLEAIYYLQILRSARGARDQDLCASAPTRFTSAPRSTRIAATRSASASSARAKRKRVRLDGDDPRAAERRARRAAVGAVLARRRRADRRRARTARRRYLDIMLALTARGYLAALQRYRTRARAAQRGAARERAIRPRRRRRASRSGSRRWPSTARCSDSGAPRVGRGHGGAFRAALSRHRRSSPRACALRRHARRDVRSRSQRSRAALEEKRGLDLRRGLTHAGPHRDDLAITITGPDGTAAICGRSGRPDSSAAPRSRSACSRRRHSLSARAARRSSCSTIHSPSSTFGARRACSTCCRGSGLGQTVLAVPRESDIPAEFTGLERVRGCGRPDRAIRSMSERKKKRPEAIGHILASVLGSTGIAGARRSGGHHSGMAQAGRHSRSPR